eukprot:CAMPEP_0170587630 /NCGR_PEP_ID=MMETSP0224-20130122/10387_1 /TAXON_ID=285029 /ORGANISM="Togula jolla, Strain CCCM 725" /LENGTH=74 /DNA_ID=CAMNT_0010911269 /DNA_START=145 /DNA_END=369 /DNA_ORIENTATION=+
MKMRGGRAAETKSKFSDKDTVNGSFTSASATLLVAAPLLDPWLDCSIWCSRAAIAEALVRKSTSVAIAPPCTEP